MQLIDGLQHYKTTTYFPWALCLEKDAECIFQLIQQYNTNPPEFALSKAKQFLIDIENWKAGCLQTRIGNACQNSDQIIWNAIYGAANSEDDRGAILAIMELKGFGSAVDDSTGQRRAKVATSVLRFLWPKKWGVVDWRVAAMLGFLDKNKWDTNNAVNEAKCSNANDYRGDFNIIDERGAIAYNKRYRDISDQYSSILPRAADVDMAVFGLSLLVWPMP